MTLLAEISAMPYVFLLLILGVIGWLLFRITRRINQKETLRPTPRMTNTARSLGTAPPPEFDRWSVEMQEIARDTLAQIDTKMRALDYLTTKATAAAQRLEVAIAQENQEDHNSVDETQSAPRTGAAPISHTTPESLDVHSQADMLERATGRTHHGDTRQGNADREPTATDVEPRRRLIYEMADRGVDLAAIATEVGSPVGEIELILGLRRQET
jgi:hypothetical protein